MKHLLTAILTAWLAWGAGAQTYVLKVRIETAETSPEGFRVSVREAGLEKITGPDGTAEFRLPEGVYTVEARKDGFYARARIRLRGSVTLVLRPERQESLREVVITATRAGEETPVTHDTLGRRALEEKYTAKDIPFLLDELPSVVSFSDPGHGVGYTGLRIRGIGPRQINVTLNGIPLNDPESQAVYWVDIPDFASTVASIELQRGVGTSTYGTGAFGANIHLQTLLPADTAWAGMEAAAGSFNTSRLSFKANTGRTPSGWAFLLRGSKIYSDGYIDRAFADMKSYYAAASRKWSRTQLHLIHFAGHERTYQAWYGVDKETFETDPTFNYAGAIYDSLGRIVRFYDNEVDDYTQKHYQLHLSRRLGAGVRAKLAAFYVRGYGYYEQYKQDQPFDKYGMQPVRLGTAVVDHTDLIRRKWLDNHFGGGVFNLFIRSGGMDWTAGLGVNRYDGLHYGEVIWARFADNTEIRHRYYENRGIKDEFNFFVRHTYRADERWRLFTDIQIRAIDYRIVHNPERTFDPDEKIDLTDKLFFVNPKIGVFYKNDTHWQAYVYAARTHREPNRTDYVENPVKPRPETLYDLEAGWEWRSGQWLAKTNLYYMYYLDQLVYSGRLDEVGNPVRENVGRSYRAGWEQQVVRTAPQWEGRLFFTLSRNRNIDYTAFDGDTLRHYGNTVIAYSPGIVAGAKFTWKPRKGWAAFVSAKHVGDQYMDNRNIPESLLPAYTRVDGGIRYAFGRPDRPVRGSVALHVYNLFDAKYAANGYMWGDTPYYYPQAERHFMAGIKLIF
ncbi:MAG: TonB-dependent receptor [Chlorobi bacterium]|nr:TonB-dependent receptor [Chlorobiota bacterium]